ncbi:MAG: hypothetical protein IH602_11280 [Bryobacteraceae bacterium]|nr:hypothetical protein [Bryobacteraceae bacterium]
MRERNTHCDGSLAPVSEHTCYVLSAAMRWMQRINAARPMLSDTLIVAAGNVVVKGAGLLKLIITAHLFGTSDAQDAFLAAFLLPSSLGDIFAASATPALVPAMVRLQPGEHDREADELYRSAFASSVAAMCAIAGLLALAAPAVFAIIASGFSGEKTQLATTLFYWLLPLLPLAGCNVVWRAVLNAHRRFALAAVAPAVTPLTTLAVLAGGASRWGIYALAFGVVAGGMAEAALLAAAVRRLGYGVCPLWRGRGEGLRDVLPQFAPLLGGSLLLGSCPLIDNAMAAGLESGSVSVLNFGTRLTTVLASIGPAAVGTAALPHLADMAARGEWRKMRGDLRWFGSLIVAAVIPVAAVLIALTEPLVRIAFQKGAFSEASTLAVAAVQRYSLLQIPFAVLSALGFRLAASLRANELFLPVAAVGFCVTVTADYLLRQALGVPGIALAATLSQIAMISTLAVLLARRLRKGRAA